MNLYLTFTKTNIEVFIYHDCSIDVGNSTDRRDLFYTSLDNLAAWLRLIKYLLFKLLFICTFLFPLIYIKILIYVFNVDNTFILNTSFIEY